MRMRRQSIDHILRAAAEVTNCKRFVLVGSAALIARTKHVPLNMMYTPEIDIYASDAEDVELASELIDGSIGQGSQFIVSLAITAMAYLRRRQKCRLTGAIVPSNIRATSVPALLR